MDDDKKVLSEDNQESDEQRKQNLGKWWRELLNFAIAVVLLACYFYLYVRYGIPLPFL